MAAVIQLMSSPVRVTAATTQDLRLSTPVLQFNELQLLLQVFEGSSVAVTIITGTQTDTEDGWVTLDTFTSTTAPNSTMKTFTSPLPYIRWKVTSSGNATIMVSGVGRTT